MSKLRVASCQFPVTDDVERNARYILAYMKKAKAGMVLLAGMGVKAVQEKSVVLAAESY